MGQTTFTIKWPTPSRLIPMASNCIVVNVTGPNGFTVSQEADRPLNGNTSILNFQLPPHTLTAIAKAFPQTGGKGVAQASGSTIVTPVAGQTTQVVLTMNSTIDQLVVTPNPIFLAPGGVTASLTATPYDAGGEIVLVAPGNIGWSSQNTAVATINPTTGVVTAQASGNTTVTATEKDSGKQGTATVKVGVDKQWIYISDDHDGDPSGNTRLVCIHDMSGTGWTTYGSLGTGTGQFVDLDGLSVGHDGKIYLTDSLNFRIVRIDDMTGANWTTLGGVMGAGQNEFDMPQVAGIGPDGKLYIADGGNNRIVRVDDMTGNNWTTFGTLGSGTGQFSFPEGIAFDKSGDIYIADWGNSRIVRMDDMTGKNWTSLGTQGSGANQYASPTSIVIGPDGKIYVADSYNCRIVRMDDMTGKNWTSLGTQGSGTNQFLYPNDLAVAMDGKIYIADTGNCRIVRVDDMTGANWTPFGSQGNGVNQFYCPYNIALGN